MTAHRWLLCLPRIGASLLVDQGQVRPVRRCCPEQGCRLHGSSPRPVHAEPFAVTACQRAHDIDERLIRVADPKQRRADAKRTQPTLVTALQLVGERVEQGRLAAAGLAGHKHSAAVAPRRLPGAGVEHGKLLFASDHGVIGARPWHRQGDRELNRVCWQQRCFVRCQESLADRFVQFHRMRFRLRIDLLQ